MDRNVRGGPLVEGKQEGDRTEAPPEEGLEIMKMLACGANDYEVARRLGVSVITVRRRVQRFCRFLGARSRLQAMAITVASGWVVPDTECRESPSEVVG